MVTICLAAAMSMDYLDFDSAHCFLNKIRHNPFIRVVLFLIVIIQMFSSVLILASFRRISKAFEELSARLNVRTMAIHVIIFSIYMCASLVNLIFLCALNYHAKYAPDAESWTNEDVMTFSKLLKEKVCSDSITIIL